MILRIGRKLIVTNFQLLAPLALDGDPIFKPRKGGGGGQYHADVTQCSHYTIFIYLFIL